VPAARAPAPAPVAAPIDTASLAAQYRAALIAEAARYKRYPRFARDNGWQGRVDVRMAIGPNGEIDSLRVARGTGYAILDRKALEMVRSAKPQTAIPGGLRGKAFTVDVPVIFSLRDDG
jgi:protein TonB